MKILIVTTNHFPYDGTCSNILNNLLFIGDLSGRVEKIDILCSKKSIDENDYENYNGVNIHRILSWTLLNRNEFLYAIKKYKYKIIPAFINRIRLYLTKRLILSSFIDYPTYKAFLNKLKKMRKNKYDIIISISGRYDCTKAVYKYVKNKNIKFIFYQVDPCSTNKIYNIKSQVKRKKLEDLIYKRADHVITTPIIFNEYKNSSFLQYLKKVTKLEFPVVIPCSNTKENNNIINCMFLGTIYGGARNPEYTLRLFNYIVEDKVQLHLVGVEEADLPIKYRNKNIICYGRKDIKTCKELMKKADFLVNIGNIVLNQVPSKIFDYISTGKPIINICESEHCPSIYYMNRYKSSINIIKGKESQKVQSNMLKQFIQKKHHILTNEEIKSIFYECTPFYCAEKINDIINKI